LREEIALSKRLTPAEDARHRTEPASAGSEEDHGADLPLSRARLFLLFFFLGGVLYFQTLGCPFLCDEYRLILGNAQAGAFRWERLPELFCHRYFHLAGSFKNDLPLDIPYYRPVAVLFHGLTYRAFGPFFPAYHLESLFLHVANALLLFTLFSTLLRKEGLSQTVALVGALFFLVHPRNVETVSIIANQTGLLCTFFLLLSLWLWARLLEGARPALLLYGFSLLTLLLAMLSKETAYVVPLMHGLVLLLVGPKDRRNLVLLCGYFLLPAIPLALRQAVLDSPSIAAALAAQVSRQGSWAQYAVSLAALLFHQLYSWLLPLDTMLFQYPLSIRQVSLGQILLPLLVLALFVWRLRRRTGVLALGFGWFLVFYLPSSNLVSIGTLAGGSLKAGAHHLYPAHAGLCLLLAGTLLLPRVGRTWQRNARWKARLGWSASALAALLLSAQTFHFAGYFRGADLFYEGLLQRVPLHTGAWTNYGWHKLYIDKDPLRSEWILLGGLQAVQGSKSLKTRMDFVNNLAVLYFEQNRPLEGDAMLQCIMDSWVLHPEGNLTFWHVIEVRERLLKQRRPQEADSVE
jgi:hypothetical protein